MLVKPLIKQTVWSHPPGTLKPKQLCCQEKSPPCPPPTRILPCHTQHHQLSHRHSRWHLKKKKKSAPTPTELPRRVFPKGRCNRNEPTVNQSQPVTGPSHQTQKRHARETRRYRDLPPDVPCDAQDDLRVLQDTHFSETIFSEISRAYDNFYFDFF